MISEEHIDMISARVTGIIHQVRELHGRDRSHLTWKNDPSTWSILECLEHLNLYGDFYLPAIEEALNGAGPTTAKEFSPGLIGGFLARSVLPRKKLNKMKTFPDKDPSNTSLGHEVIERFLAQQERLLVLLDRARSADLNRIRVKTFLSRFLKLKLGDIFQFMINHEMRHLRQIEGVQQRMEALMGDRAPGSAT
ncbi:MAG: DinB family protein [Flavobacteriales bacterium]